MAARRAGRASAKSKTGLVALTWIDLAGIARVRAIPAKHLGSKKDFGLSFPSCGQALDMFGGIVDNPWGALGDVRQIPVLPTMIDLKGDHAGRPGLQMVLSEALGGDGKPWPLCTRTFLRHVIDRYVRELKIRPFAAFEHEFKLFRNGSGEPAPLSMTIEALRYISPLDVDIVEGLEQAGIGVEGFEPEYASHQYEVSVAPKDGLRAADEAVLLREIVRDCARGNGYRATFVPKSDPELGGSGLHIHISLRDRAGKPVLYDGGDDSGLSDTGRKFVAGILAHARALLPFVAPGVISYYRLGPGKWSSGFAAYGTANREAMLRLCSLPTSDSARRAASFNIEFRAADGLCNPYLALGMILSAGLHGIVDGLEPPPPLDIDPTKLSGKAREAFENIQLPTSLAAALKHLDEDDVAKSWLPPELLETFVTLRREELRKLGKDDPAAICKRYMAVY
jgi:glutamine synthetase